MPQSSEAEPKAPGGEEQPLCADAKTSSAYDPQLEEFDGRFTDKFEIGQVTIRLPLDTSPAPLAALILSFVPWVLPLVVLTDLVCQKRFLSFFALCLMLMVLILSEAVLKPLLKQPRPETTAVRYPDGSVKPGMPSGHVLNTHTLVTFFCFQAPHELDGLLAFLAIIFLLTLSAACAWARVRNGDHSPDQVAVSFALATVIGFVGYVVQRTYFRGGWDSTAAALLETSFHTPSLRGA